MIKLGCHSKNYGIADADENLGFISKLGFEYVTLETGVIGHKEAAENPAKAAERTRALLDKHNLKPVEYVFGGFKDGDKGYHPSFVPADKIGSVCRDFDSICKFAKLAGFSSVMGGAGEPIDGASYDEVFDGLAKTLGRLVPIAKDNGVSLNIEPGQRSILNSPDKSIAMAQAVPGLSYTLDILHYQVHGYSTEDSVKVLPYANHLHARQAATGWNKCPIEHGEIDFDLVMKRLRGMFWDGAITMEFWLTPSEARGNMSAVDQTIVMRYQLKQLIRKYWSDTIMPL